MKTFNLSVVVFVVSAFVLLFAIESRCDECKLTRGRVIPNCIMGNVEIDSAENLERVQNAKWIFGSVFVVGQMMLGDDRMDELDLGNLEWMSGVVIIQGNPYLKHFYADNLKHASYISVINNPMLAPCDVWDIGEYTECLPGVSCVDADMFDEFLNSGECVR